MVAALLRWAADGLEEEPGGQMEICNYYPLLLFFFFNSVIDTSYSILTSVLHHRSSGKSASLNTNINMLEFNSRDLRLCVLGRRQWIS